MKTLLTFFLIWLASIGSISGITPEPNLKFGGIQSSIYLNNSGVLEVDSNNLVVNGGQINRSQNGNITGNSFYFDRGILASFLSSSFISGYYEPNINNIEALKPYYDPNAPKPHWGALELGPTTDINFIIANPGGLYYMLYVRSGIQYLRGQPLFFGENDIVLEDNTAELAIAIQNTLNTNIILNGGVLALQDDLKLGNDAVIKNGNSVNIGLVDFNDRRLSLGGGVSTWDDSIIWNMANDMQLNNQTTLNGIWVFYGDAQINGNGNVLDISGGGTIYILPGSTLRMSSVNLVGLGAGNFYVGDGANLVLSNVEIEMDADFIFDVGNVYVNGDSNIITKDYFLTFTTNIQKGTKGTLTVDGVALTYDTLGYSDQHNIQPTPQEDPAHEFVNILNKGSIRTLRVESISFTILGNNTKLQRYMILWPDRPMTIYAGVDSQEKPVYDFTIDGSAQFLGFTSSESPLLTVDNDVHVVFENILFRDFAPAHLHLNPGASLTFGNNSSIRIWQDDTLNYPWVFQGNTNIRGGGAIITLGEEGEIVLKGENSTLWIEGITIKGIKGKNIRCESNTSKIILQNLKWVQDEDYTFETGSLEILNDVLLMGDGTTFNFKSNQPSIIDSNSTMRFMWGITFNYEPSDNMLLNLIKMTDKTSALAFDTANLSAPNGIQLTTGRLTIQDECYSSNDTNAIIFGDGTKEGNLLFDRNLMFQQLSGDFVDKNV